MAEARVGFRAHAAAYVLVNLLLAAVWWLSDRGDEYWPVWPHLGWGVGLAFHAWGVYGGGGRGDAVAREEARLRAKFGRP